MHHTRVVSLPFLPCREPGYLGSQLWRSRPLLPVSQVRVQESGHPDSRYLWCSFRRSPWSGIPLPVRVRESGHPDSRYLWCRFRRSRWSGIPLSVLCVT
ncbi:hypothetical protein NDU88_003007 [Pleurodeles waltl]|uniref:Integron gene cassette protein n=1 Tax=Pleurodeles waltl TaxID=8319 RepID=A0AAV7RCN2_PLEWA|nr:hypothetical protein NDU88_003007 [Pleurodeles waltl]